MIERYRSNDRMSQIVTFPLTGTMVALAGLVADNRDGSIEEQTADVLAKIDVLLKEAGTDKSHVTHVNIWLPDIGDFQQMNSIYDTWVAKGAAPARACVEARLADPRLKVEIQAFAWRP